LTGALEPHLLTEQISGGLTALAREMPAKIESIAVDFRTQKVAKALLRRGSRQWRQCK
jgi:hypothetical protein